MAQDLERLELELVRSEIDLRFRLLLFGVRLAAVAGAAGAAALYRLRDERRAGQPGIAGRRWASSSLAPASASDHEGRTAHR